MINVMGSWSTLLLKCSDLIYQLSIRCIFQAQYIQENYETLLCFLKETHLISRTKEELILQPSTECWKSEEPAFRIILSELLTSDRLKHSSPSLKQK